MWFDLNFPSEQRHVEVLAKIVCVYTYAGQGKFIIDCASTSTMGNGIQMYRFLGITLHCGSCGIIELEQIDPQSSVNF